MPSRGWYISSKIVGIKTYQTPLKLITWYKEVEGFLSLQEEDLLHALCSMIWPEWEFRKAPPTNSLGRLMPGDCWIGWDPIIRTNVFYDYLVWGGSSGKLYFPLPSWDMSFSLYDEIKNGECHGSQDLWTSNDGLSFWDDEEFAWWFRFCCSEMQVGATTYEKFTILPFRVKIECPDLIGCAGQ
jgi:hypothetical protein